MYKFVYTNLYTLICIVKFFFYTILYEQIRMYKLYTLTCMCEFIFLIQSHMYKFVLQIRVSEFVLIYNWQTK